VAIFFNEILGLKMVTGRKTQPADICAHRGTLKKAQNEKGFR
jgi:hypothetical protein